MADAAEDAAGLPSGTIGLKWPNDLVVELTGAHASLAGLEDPAAALARLTGPLSIRKLGGVLGETEGLGTAEPRVVVGVGLDVDWPAAAIPADLAASMTTLRAAAGGRPIDRPALLDAFLDRLATRHAALASGYFDVAGWSERQVTTGRWVGIEAADGSVTDAFATGVDGASGALLLADGELDRAVMVGEVARIRLAEPAGAV